MPTIDDPIKSIDPSSVSPFPVAIKWGLIGASCQIIIDLVGYLTGALQPGDVLYSFVIFAIAVFCVTMAIKEHKSALGGYLRGARGVWVGLLSGVVYGIIAGIWGLIFYHYLVPDFHEQMAENMVIMFENWGFTDDQIDQIMEGQTEQTPLQTGLGGVFGGIIAGLLLSIIPTLIMKKKHDDMFS